MDDSKTLESGFTHDDAGLSHESPVWFAAEEDDSGWESVEIVDELTWSDAVDESEGPGPTADPFLRLVAAVEEAACSFGAGNESIHLLRGLLGVTRLDVAVDPAARSSLLSADILTQSSAGIVRSDRFTRQVLAWQDILREKSEDFSGCGAATLDEWGADLVARTLGSSQRSDAIRRELRKRGVAAFGLVAAA
jgi:hypothetical protein